MDVRIIWSKLGLNGELNEHEDCVVEVMDALQKAGLKVSIKKLHFTFCTLGGQFSGFPLL